MDSARPDLLPGNPGVPGFGSTSGPRRALTGLVLNTGIDFAGLRQGRESRRCECRRHNGTDKHFHITSPLLIGQRRTSSPLMPVVIASIVVLWRRCQYGAVLKRTLRHAVKFLELTNGR